MVAAFGGVVPLDGCVAFAGGFEGAGAAEGPDSFAPSGGTGGVGLTGGFTSPSWPCCFGVTGGGGAGEGTAGTCV